MIKQTVQFSTTSDVIYEILMDEKKHSAFTGAKATIDPHVNGKFSVWDGYATGQNIELIPGKKIVQLWHASDWQDDEMSKVTFAIKTTENGSEIELIHENVPDRFENEIEKGWKDYYWRPLKKYINQAY